MSTTPARSPAQRRHQPKDVHLREPSTELQEVGCRACLSEERDFETELSGYRFHRCRGCGLFYMSPRPAPSALRQLYDEHYFESRDPSVGYPTYLSDRESLRDKSRRLLDVIERHHTPGRLLDVGCAYGFLLELARERGWEVHGIEPAPRVAESVGKKLGIAVPADLSEARFPDRSFDAVAIWDVVEHLDEPRDTMLEIRRILRPGGVCSIVTPDLGSLAARILGSSWEERQKLPEHIYFFDRKSLARLLTSTGFEVIEWGTVGKLMPVREAAERLAPSAPRLFRPALRILETVGLADRVLYLDPRWKLSVVARSRG